MIKRPPPFALRPTNAVSVLLLVVLTWSGGGNLVRAQPLDQRLFFAVYRIEAPAFETWMRVADATAMPVFVGGVPAAGAGAWIVRGGGDWTDAYELSLSEAGTLAAALALKALVHRTRPYRRFDGVVARGREPAEWDPWSFPAGHAAVSFALATSYSLSHARWYVVAPAYAWAASVSLSRVWLGVHYPGDVMAGALLGSLVAWGVSQLAPEITPDALEPDEAAGPVIGFRVLF